MQPQDYEFFASEAEASSLREKARAEVVSWRWATESMAVDIPFAKELYGGSRSRWLNDNAAKPEQHRHHGIDAAGRIVIECYAGKRETVWLYADNSKTGVEWSLHHGDISLYAVTHYQYWDNLLVAEQTYIPGRHQLSDEFIWQDGLLLRRFRQTVAESRDPWYSQHVFIYDKSRELERIVLQYTDADGVPSGQERLEYLRLPKGETQATIETQLEMHLLDAFSTALAQVPREQPLYCLLLCYTAEDIAAAWPPFLVWGTEAYRQQIVVQGEDISYYLWAPDEIRELQAAQYEHWFKQPELKDICLVHAQLMSIKQSYNPAIRLLQRLVPDITRLVKESGLLLTEDFVVTYVDNTGNVDPSKAIKANISAEQWAALKRQKYV